MIESKPFCISKWAVLSAWARVLDNKGAAGVDDVSIEAFEQKLKSNLTRAGTKGRHVIGIVHAAAGAKGDDPQGRRQTATAWYPDRGRPGGADGSENGTGA